MANNRGKEWEERFKKDFLATVENSVVIRIPDQVSKNKETSRNICDFICYAYPLMYLIECKTVKEGRTFQFSKFRQYDLMIKYKDIVGICPYVVIWFQEYDKVLAVRIDEIERMKNDGKKSININMLKEKMYNIIDIQTSKLRIFVRGDYSVLINHEANRWR